jgi:hypothetical protein
MTSAFFVRTGRPKTPHDGTVQTLLENQISLTFCKIVVNCAMFLSFVKNCVTCVNCVNGKEWQVKHISPGLVNVIPCAVSSLKKIKI